MLPGLPPAPRVRIRRRRLALVAGLGTTIVLAAIAIAALAGGKGATRPPTRPATTARARAKPATDSEADLTTAVRNVLAYTPFVREGNGSGHDVALTFDDGPGPYTPGVLTELERLHTRATFFTIGRMLRYFSSSTVREIEDGDTIGDHTENHPMLAQLTVHEQHEELFEPLIRIEALGSKRPMLFRPPYGSFDAATMRQLHGLHLLMVLWSVDTNDYLQPGVATIVQRALAGAHPGAIILMHDGGGNRSQTIAALPAIVRGLSQKGLHLVTVPQLLADEPPTPGQPLPPNLSGD